MSKSFPITVVYVDLAGKDSIKRHSIKAHGEHLARREILDRYLAQGLRVKKIQIEHAGV